MPRLKLNLPRTNKAWTKTPNYLIDTLMPTLKDTELRIVLLLLRATNGWNREGRPVIVPYRVLIQKTGRKSASIGKAIKSLRARGVIHNPGASTQSTTPLAKMDTAKSEEQQYTDSY